jgi:hypothetical protein
MTRHDDFARTNDIHLDAGDSPSADLAALARGRGQMCQSSGLPSLSVGNVAAATALRPPSKKARLHRKRHVPVGPAGVWFQTNHRRHQHPTGVGTSTCLSRKDKRNEARSNSEDLDEEELLAIVDGASPSLRRSPSYSADAHGSSQGSGSRDDKQSSATSGGLSLCSPAWMCMQCDLGLVLPAIPVGVPVSEAERCTIMRKCLPSHYRLLPELVHRDGTEWRMRDRKVLVLVQAIQSLTDNLWTVKVTDETLASLTAWIQPALVRQEQQRQQPKYVRPGLVWQLSDPTTILVGSDAHNHHHLDGGEEGNNLERMLLVSEDTIERVWTPSQAKSVSDETFVAWLEQRNVLSASVMTELESGRKSPARPTTRLNASAEVSQRARHDSFEEDEADDRAPVDAVHESDDEEFTFQSTQPPLRSVAAPQCQPQSRTEIQQYPPNSQGDRMLLPTPDLRSSVRVPHNATAEQRDRAYTSTNATEHNGHALYVNTHSCSSSYSSETQVQATAVHQALSTSETLQAQITSLQRIDHSQAASYNDTHLPGRSICGNAGRPTAGSGLSVTTAPHAPFAIPPTPTAPLRSPGRVNGSGTFGFSQFLSQPVTNPTIPSSQAGNDGPVSSDRHAEANAGKTPPPPPLAGSQRRDSTKMSSKSKKRRRRRSSTVEDQRSPANQTSPMASKLPSVLWSSSACNASLLEMFDDDDSDDAVECLFGTRKSKVASTVETADNTSGTGAENSNNGIELPRQPSLFDVDLGLDEFFSDAED